MIFMLRTRTWVPGRAVPWALGRLPWAPGAPPRGSPGGFPTPNYKGHFQPSTLQIRIEIYVDLDVDFWSLWARSWVPLGDHFRSCWRLFRPKLVSEPSSKRLIFEKVTKHSFSNGVCSKLSPRWGQDRPKIAPRWVHYRLGSPFVHLEFSLRFLIVWGSALVPFWPPKWSPGGVAELC